MTQISSVSRTEIKGYSELNQIYSSRRTRVCRAKRNSDALPVILKILSHNYPSWDEIIRYKHEYDLLRKFHNGSTIHAYDLEKISGSYVMELEDIQGTDLETLFQSKTIELKTFFPIAIQMARALGDIHAAHLVHKDINLSNTVYNPDTHQVKIIDFGLATTLTSENPEPVNPNRLTGTLAYISPEQTGRMNREIDYRTDFYSLGIAFYKLLTGVLPFRATDAMELIYCQIAKQCISANAIEPSIGNVISDIIAKLMSKNAEDRYQSAHGIIADLQECLNQLEDTGSIAPFPLAQKDSWGSFKLTQKLYGREKNVRKLIDIFDLAAQGTPQLVMVSGYSGVGKTALVREVQKPITEKRGNFGAGKFDPLQKSTPYSAFIHALSQFVGYLLKEDAESLSAWKSKICRAIGLNGKVLIDVIPTLELIIGPQPAIPRVRPAEAKNRFNLVFSAFINAVSQKEHPLVLFIDDLQWVDFASLNLIKHLMTDTSINYLFLIGAYRDNEVDALHPLRNALREISEECTNITYINLSGLSAKNVKSLTADTLHCSEEKSSELAELVYEKTQGNAFYLTQFLKSLPENNLLTYSNEDSYWEWDIQNIKKKNTTVNVVELMIRKIERLSDEAQHTLKLSACIGNCFDIQTLATIYEKSTCDTLDALWEAIEEGLVIPEDDSYQTFSYADSPSPKEKSVFKFLHDRVQQAVYSLIPEDGRQPIHLQISRLLLNNATDAQVEDNLFFIVNHLNRGKSLINKHSEKVQFVELNLHAGRKAKSSAAYDSAVSFFRQAASMPLDNSWKNHHNLIYDLHIEQSECEFFVGEFGSSRKILEEALKNSNTAIEKGQVFIQLIAQHSIQGKYTNSIHSGIEAYACFGIKLPPLEDKKAINVYIEKQEEWYNEQWGGKSISRLYDLPSNEDPGQEILKIISVNLFDCCLISAPFYLPVLTFTAVNLSIKNGNTPNSAYAYAGQGMIMSSRYRNYSSAYEFGLVGKRIAEEKTANLRTGCKTLNAFWGRLSHFKTDLKLVPNEMEKAYQLGFDGGDFVHASYCLVNGHRSLMSVSTNLEEAEILTKQYLEKFKKCNAMVMHDLCRASSGAFIHYMRGNTESVTSFDTNDFKLSNFLSSHPSLDLFSVFPDAYRILGFYIMEQYQLALKHVLDFESKIDSAENYIHGVEYRFHASLVYLRIFKQFDDQEQSRIWKKVNTYYQFVKKVAINAPSNFKKFEYLIAAEMARVKGNGLVATRLYDKAIQSASESDHTQLEAIANECAAKFWLENNKADFAAIHIRKSYYCYNLWGAKRKTEALERQHMQLIAPINIGTINTATTSGSEKNESSQQSLDTSVISNTYDLTSESVLKVSQAISKEITLGGFLKNMMNILIENSGAQKGILLLENNGKYRIEAEGSEYPNETVVLQSHPLEDVNKNGRIGLPISVINYVARTNKDVILAEATKEEQFMNDEYIIQHQPYSVLCHPIEHHNKIMGILYLENCVTKGLFNTHHLEFLQLLSSQVAISIENAYIYKNLEDLVDQRTQELTNAQEQLIEAGKMAALAQLVSGIAHEINTPIGVGVTAASSLCELTSAIERKFKQNTLGKVELENYMKSTKEISHTILNNITRAANLVKNFKQIGIDQLAGEAPHKFNFNQYIQECIGSLKYSLKLENYKITIENTHQLTLASYPTVIYQILGGLLTNTKMHAYAPEEAGEIHINIQEIDKCAELKYSDKGCGISKDKLSKIFDPFFTTRRGDGAIGLGLPVIYNSVVQQLKGTISCHSVHGEGTDFTIRVPLLRSAHTEH